MTKQTVALSAIKQTTSMAAALALCFVAGCNRGAATNNGAATNTANAAAPAPVANASANAATPAPAAGQARLNLVPAGMEAVEGARRDLLRFGSPVSEALPGLTGLFGPPAEDATNSDCGAGPTRIIGWSNGFRILAQGDRFQGWEVQQAGINALDDLQVGMTRAQLEANQASFEQTSLGTEWTVGDGDQTVSGLLGEDGKVSAMWAGLTCHMT